MHSGRVDQGEARSGAAFSKTHFRFKQMYVISRRQSCLRPNAHFQACACPEVGWADNQVRPVSRVWVTLVFLSSTY